MTRSSDPQKVAFWQARIDAQAQSGLTIANFCKQQKFSIGAFYQWKRKLQTVPEGGQKSAPDRPRPQTTNTTNFVELLPRQAAVPGGAMIEIHLRSGSLVRFPSGSIDLLQAVVETLRDEL